MRLALLWQQHEWMTRTSRRIVSILTGRESHGSRRIVVLLGVAGLALSLSACGDDGGRDPDGDAGGVVLRGTESNGPSDGPSGSTSPSGGGDNASPSTDGQGGAPPVATTVLDPGSELEVEDQRGTGSQVVVSAARLTVGQGLVVIVDPASRDVLGSVAVPASGGRDLRVPLETAVQGRQELVALLYADDGVGGFDPSGDGRIVDEEGEPASEDFDYQPGGSGTGPAQTILTTWVSLSPRISTVVGDRAPAW